MHPKHEDSEPRFPVDRRWRKATQIAQRGRISPQRDDALTIQAVRFLRQRQRVTSPQRLLRLRVNYPEVSGAVALAEGPWRIQVELRGRWLARQTALQIADAMRLHPTEIEAYHDLFFDVTGLLDASRYIMTEAIGSHLAAPLSLEQMALLNAWRHGPLALEAYLDYIDRKQDSSQPPSEVGTPAWQQDLAIEVQMAAQGASLTPGNAMLHLHIWRAIQDMARRPQLRTTVGQLLRQTVGHYLENTPVNWQETPSQAPETAWKAHQMAHTG